MRLFRYFVFGALSVCLLSPALLRAETAKPQPNRNRIALNPLRPLKSPRTLISESKTRLPSGQLAVQQLWRWKSPRLFKAQQRNHQIGNLRVSRNYTPMKNGKGTLVEQLVLYTKAPRRKVTPEVAQATKVLSQVMSLAKQRYVEPVSEAKILRDAARGVTQGLDRHTNFYDPQQFDKLQIHLRGSGVGVGIGIKEKANRLTIDRTYHGPARRAGVRKGDRLLSVNGQAVSSVVKAAQLLGGKEGSTVKVQVERGGKKLDLSIQRAAVDFNPVRGRLTRDGIGHIRLKQFDSGAADKVRGALAKLEKRNHGPLKGLVLDLRNNPGGSMREATSILNTFVGKGVLVSTKRRGGVVGDVHKADASKVTHGKLPLTVLINGRSASASELVSGALRDHGRATLIGDKSYGKGTVQSVLPLADGSGVKMTMARYHLPKGQTPDKIGVTPDISSNQAKQNYKKAHPQATRRIVDYSLEQAFSVLRGK